MSPLIRARNWLALIITSIVLVACGGGGGDTGPSATLTVTPGALSFTGYAGKALPSPQDVTVEGRGPQGATIVVDLSPGATLPSWLKIDLGAGSVDRYSIVSNNLAPGNYSTSIRYSAVATDKSILTYKDLPVTLTIRTGLSASPAALQFDYLQGAALPAAQSITIGDAGLAWVASASQSWVKLGATSGTAPSTLAVSVDPSALIVGINTASITINSDGQVSIVNVSVTVIAPTFVADKTSVSFAGIYGVPFAPQTINLSSNVPSGVTWLATSTAPWLVLSKTTGSTPDALQLSINPLAANLTTGNYTATVNLMATYQNKPLGASVSVSLNGTSPAFQLSSSALSFSGINGTTIAGQAINIDSNVTTPVAWNAVTSAPWLILSQSTGSTKDTLGISIAPSASKLASGTYSGTVTLSGAIGGVPMSSVINIALNLTKPTLSVTPTSIILGGAAGRDFSAQQVSMKLNTDFPYAWTTLVGANWLNANATSGTVGPVASSFSVTPNRTLLTGGTHSTVITVIANVNGDSITQTVPVKFNLDAHKIIVADNGVAFSSTPTWSRVTRTVKVTDNMGLPTNWSATSNQSWLSVTPAGTADGNLVLTANPAGLAPDKFYEATVSLTSTDATVENRETIQVGFWVGSTTPTNSFKLATQYLEVKADPVRPYVYAHNGGASIDVIHVYTGATIFTMPSVGARLGDMTISRDGSKLFVVDATNSKIIPVDLATRTALTSWPMLQAGRLEFSRPNGVSVILAGDGRAYDASGRVLGNVMPSGAIYSASRDGKFFYSLNIESSLSTLLGFSIDYTAMNSGTLLVKNFAVGSNATTNPSNGQDIAVSADGLIVYSANSDPYEFLQYNATDLTSRGALPGTANPNNVQVGSDGRVYGAVANWYAPADVWSYDANGVALKNYRVGGYAKTILPRQLVISGDGLMMIVLTNDPSFQIIPVGP